MPNIEGISNTAPHRLEGLDIARFLAFVGMVIVNFKTVIGIDTAVSNPVLLGFSAAFEGRAAATFVVLAGMGLGLAATRETVKNIVPVTLKRAVFLLVVGLINAIIFEADILHYYAFYFLFGVFFLRANTQILFFTIFTLIFGFVGAVMVFDYDQGWHWESLTYIDFWNPEGMIRNLFFNGWHPVLPWFAFFLFGILLSRIKLHTRQVQISMLIGGLIAALAIETLSYFVTHLIGPHDPEEIRLLFVTKPVPPMPFYMVAGMSVATSITGLCLLLENWMRKTGILKVLTPAGRQTLTLYIAHILVGMGALDAFGMIENPQNITTIMMAASIFTLAAVLYAYLWRKRFKRGPVETLMRTFAG